MNLSVKQREFLDYHKIDERFIFDATGIRHKDYGKIMKNIGLFFAIGVTPCQKGGHTLRNRKGQCIQCNTANIAFMLRSGKNAYIYVVGSLKGKVLKVGFTKDVNDRLEHLVEDKYGGLNDWELLYRGKYDNALKFENLIHNSLSNVHYNIEYDYYGKNIICNEIFRCGFLRIQNIIEENKNSFGKVEDEFCFKKGIEKYNFVEENKKVLNKKNSGNGGTGIEQLLKEAESKVDAYEDALDKLGDHEILGPLNEKLLKGEEINLEEYLKENSKEEIITVNTNIRDRYIKYIGTLAGLRENGYLSIEECDKQRGIIVNGIENEDIYILEKYKRLDEIVELEANGELEEDEFIDKLNNFLNINNMKTEILNEFGNITKYLQDDIFLISGDEKKYSLRYLLDMDIVIKYEKENVDNFMGLYLSIANFCKKYHSNAEIKKLISILLMIQGIFETKIISVIGDNPNKKEEALGIIKTAKINLTEGLSLFNDLKQNGEDYMGLYDELWFEILEKYNVDIGVTSQDPITIGNEATYLYSVPQVILETLENMEKQLNPKRKITLFGWFLIIIFISIIIYFLY